MSRIKTDRPDDRGADKQRMRCPHCDHHLVVRSSRAITPLTKQKTLQCRNPRCGASFSYVGGIDRQISPSACPNPRVDIPMAAPRARSGPDNDDQPKRLKSPEEVPRPANDDDHHHLKSG